MSLEVLFKPHCDNFVRHLLGGKKSGFSDEPLDEVSGNMVDEFLLILRCGTLNALRWIEVDDVLLHGHVELVQWEYIDELVCLRSNIYRTVVGLCNEGKLV